MRKLLLAAIYCATAAAAVAAGYEDFLRAGGYQRVGNTEKALEAYTAALNDGDLAPAYLPEAYRRRGQIYLGDGKCALALADFDAALKLRPTMQEVLNLRASSHECLGHADAALADLTTRISLAPSADAYGSRGEFHWSHGDFALAAEDFDRAAGLHKKGKFEWHPASYSLLWYAVSAKRVNAFEPAAFAIEAKEFDLAPWPGPLVSFILGTLSQAAVYAEAAKGDGDSPKLQKCEADFFLAEWQGPVGNPASKALLQGVADNCPVNSSVANAAKANLRRMP